jgi:hypothetical protein
VKHVLKEDYGIDLDKDRKNLSIDVFLVEEKDNPSSGVKLIFTLRKLPKGLRRNKF